MIIKRTRGFDAGKALAYDYGPGKAMEHHNPRRVAGTVPGRDWRVRARAMQAKIRDDGDTVSPSQRAAVRAWQKQQRDRAKEGKKGTRGPAGSRGGVIRLAVSAAPGDRVMSDREWSDIARRVVGEFTQDADRYDWEAVRHDPQHIHITLLRRGHDGKLLNERDDQDRYGRISAGLERDYQLQRVDHSRTNTPERKRARTEGRRRAAAMQRSQDKRAREVPQHEQKAPATTPIAAPPPRTHEEKLAAAYQEAQRNQAERERINREREQERGGRER